MDGTILKITSRNLECILTTEQKDVNGRRLAQVIGDIEAVEDDRKTKMKDYGAKLKGLKKEQRVLARSISTGSMFQDVDIEIVIIGEGVVRERRKDTGEWLGDSRPSTPEESQIALDAFEREESEGEARQQIFDQGEDPEDKVEPGVTPIRTGEPIGPGQTAAEQTWDKMGKEKAELDKQPIKLSTLKIEAGQGDNAVHRIDLNGYSSKGKRILTAAMKVLQQNGLKAQTPEDMVNLLLPYPDSTEKKELLDILTGHKPKE